MKTTLKVLLSISVLALMLPVSTSAEPHLTLLGYGWGYWAGQWQWLDDSANYYARVSLADESKAPDGDYMVRFNRIGYHPSDSSMSYSTVQAGFSIVNGQVRD